MKIEHDVHEVSVKNYFAAKAANYDRTDDQIYWKFSDEVLWNMLRVLVLDRYDRHVQLNMLDAGGGTGRWTKRVLDYLPNCHATLVDLSPEMLDVAREKFSGPEYINRVQLCEGNLHDLVNISSDSFDLILCLHNVLSFVFDPLSALRELHRVAKAGAAVVSVVANRYHAFYFTIATGRQHEALRVKQTGRVRFGIDTPDMHVFTPGELTALHSQAGGRDTKSFGFPVTIYPSIEETQVFGTSRGSEKALSSASAFQDLLEIEMEACFAAEAASRGNMLLSLSYK